MQDFALREIALAIPFEHQIAVVVILGILLITRIIMNRHKNFKQNLIKLKEIKSEVIKKTLKELDNLYFLSDKLIRDKEVIGLFNTDTIILALQTVNRLEKMDEGFDDLEDASFVPLLRSYLEDSKLVLSEIYHLENNLYETQKKSEQLVISYDRAFNKLNTDQDYDRTEEIRELKQKFKQEMASYKVKMSELEQSYLNHRDALEERLLNLSDTNEGLQEMLERYKRENIESKKLYLKHLVYA